MKVYQGSDVVVKKPKILPSNRLLDFGIGFYATSSRKQAICWAEKVSLRNNTGRKFLPIYSFDIEKAQKKLNVIEFTGESEKWLDFITANRRGREIFENYDVVIGSVADDNVYLTVKLFETGVLDKEEALKRLKVEKLFDQILFHTNEALNFCLFESYKKALKIFKDNDVFNYIEEFYDVLHSNGQDYIVEDIDIYVNSRKLVNTIN